MPNKNQLHATVVQHTNGQKQSMISLPVHRNISNSKVKYSPISKISLSSSKTKNCHINKFESKEQSLIPLHLTISKELTITPVNDTKNNIISKIKKYPEISIDLIKFEPMFKVPEPPKPKNKNTKKSIPSNLLKDKEATNTIILNSTMNLNVCETFEQKQKSKQEFNKTSWIIKSSNKEILKNPEASNKMCSVLEKESVQKTSSSNLSKNIQSSMIKSISLKTDKPVEEISNNHNTVNDLENRNILRLTRLQHNVMNISIKRKDYQPENSNQNQNSDKIKSNQNVLYKRQKMEDLEDSVLYV
ncbi:rho GTPase-activating protein gacZ-like [Aphis craccivora]|uniref:Rho GTPase-activating protein gacZ-like n=1 Tax=Aphis craccivora TaxID=307492 RepID=A0A6G0YAG7_APHCR|nr:rho GTPase-activating protein gacZ-like [Aphis craccivora]